MFLLSKNDDKTPTEEDIWQMYFNGLLRKDIIWKENDVINVMIIVHYVHHQPSVHHVLKEEY